MTFDEIFQNYVNYGFTKPVTPITYGTGIESLAPIETPITSQQRDDGPNSATQIVDIDYTKVPSLLSQYMRPTGILDVVSLLMSPVTYVAKRGFDYAKDQSLAKDVQVMGQNYDPYGLGDPGVDYGRAGGGGFGGGTAGGFSESDPTATEGSFAKGGIVSLYGKRT